MKGWTRAFMSVVTVMVVFALSAMWTVPVLADDGVPPTETPAESQPAGEASAAQQAPTEAAPVDEAPPAEVGLTLVTPVEAAAVEELPPADQVTAAETSVPQENPVELLAQVPEGTDVVVVNEGGEAVPLATAEAAQIIAKGDPIWCPTGVAPIDLTGGCSDSWTKLEDLISNIVSDLGAQPAANGVIWINYGVDDSTSASIDASTFTTWKDFSLTLQGAWSGASGSTSTNPLTPSIFAVPLEIKGWNAAVTLNDIVITGATTGPAMNVTTSGKVTLTRVDAHANSGSGAHIDNTAGTGDVLVTTGDFKNNGGGIGLEILSRGTITLVDVTASENGGAGAVLDNHTAPSAKNVVLTSGEFEFNSNGVNGLTIYSIGAVLLKDITAVANNDPNFNGVWVDNCGYDWDLDTCTGVGTAGVSMTGTNLLSENLGGGLVIVSRGAISISNLIANANSGGTGALIKNSDAITAQPVTFTGTNETKFNFRGIRILSQGAVSLNNLTSINNNHAGLSIENNFGFNSNVTLTGTNTFMNNGDDGIAVYSLGAISMNNVTAFSNGWGGGGWGALLDNSGASIPEAVKLSGTNDFTSNQDGGLSIHATGAVTLSNLSANNNQAGGGAYVSNTFLGNGLPQNVTLTGYGNFIHNLGWNGLTVNSYGMITLANLEARLNLEIGASLDNFQMDALTPKAISLTGNNTFEWNGSTGLSIYSYGAITVNNLRATDNGWRGAYLNNMNAGTTAGINVINTPSYGPEFSRNKYDGLMAYSNGPIILKDFTAYENGGVGVYLDNTGDAAANVTIGTSRAGWCNGMSSNNDSGLEVYSMGIVTTSNLCIDGNGDDTGNGYGAMILNNSASSPKAVILKGENSFNGNYDYGLFIQSKGAITLNQVTANDSITGGGVYLTNKYVPASPQNIKLNGYGDFNNNHGTGLKINSYGTVLLNSVHAEWNSGSGIDVDNVSGTWTPKAVTINGYANVYSNTAYGLTIYSKGAIKINSLDAWGNLYGAYLDNHEPGSVGSVTITGLVNTGENIDYGLTVKSLGDIAFTLTDANSKDNGTYGWNLDNSFNGASGGITLNVSSPKSINLIDNGSYGLWAQSLGTIKVTHLRAGGNGWDVGGWGAKLENNFSYAVGTITITTKAGSNSFWNNSGVGLVVNSKGAITVNNLYTDSNDNDGALLNNTYSGMGSPQKVTINGYGNFYRNGDSGLVVASYGLITTTNLVAYDNGVYNFWAESQEPPEPTNPYGWGVFLDNCGWDGSDCLSYGAPQGITLNGTNDFRYNYQDGLWVTSLGAVKASNINAQENNRDGAYINNGRDETHTYGITLTGTNYFYNNNGGGLTARSNGSITISNLNANWNKGDGADLNTVNWVTAPANVTLTGTNNFIGNDGSGLSVDANGVITINNLTASWNDGGGAYLMNTMGPIWRPIPALTISLTGVNTFYGNGDNGLSLDTYGNVSLTKITADLNGSDGVSGYTSADPGDPLPNITITCGSMTNNGFDGWNLSADGTITLIGVTSYGNATGNYSSTPPVIVRTCPLP
jgi:putative surface-exposed virulence protein